MRGQRHTEKALKKCVECYGKWLHERGKFRWVGLLPLAQYSTLLAYLRYMYIHVHLYKAIYHIQYYIVQLEWSCECLHTSLSEHTTAIKIYLQCSPLHHLLLHVIISVSPPSVLGGLSHSHTVVMLAPNT